MKQIAIIAIIALLAVACTPATPAPVPTETPSPTATAAPPPTATDTPAPKPSVWDDRTPFAAGLLPDQQSALDDFPQATVYRLSITLADDLTHVTGHESLRFFNAENVPLSEIYFRLFPNILGGAATVSDLKIDDAPAEFTLELQDSAMRVPLAEPLAPGESVVLAMDFAVTVPTTEGRNYASFAYLDGILALPHFYPMVAVYDDEGWNVEIPPTYGDVVYADTSFYLAEITAPAGVTLVTSGVTLDSQTTGDTQTIRVAAGPMRDFYLAASADYPVVSAKVDGTTVNSFTPAANTVAAKKALGYITAALEFYNGYLGEYPFTELDLVATPTTAGGIEYPGAIVLALGLYDRQGQFFQVAAVHETAHQWFYSLVGNDQIDDPWLDESLVQYLTWRFYREEYGATGDAQMQSVMNRYWDRAERAKTPIGEPVAAYDEANYGAIVYGRGPIFFHTLEDTIGTKPFDKFLRTYFQTYEYGIATPADLQAAAEDACGCDLTQLFNDWVYPQ